MQRPNCKLMPDEMSDALMEMDKSGVRVAIAIWRDTFSIGVGKVRHTNESLSKLCRLSANGVIQGVLECMERGILLRERVGSGFEYFLNLEGEKEPEQPLQPVLIKQMPAKKVPTEQQLMVGALAKVTKRDVRMNASRFGKLASQLLSSGYTSEQILKIYGDGGIYWKEDWRVLKSANPQPPNESAIRDTIQQYAEKLNNDVVEVAVKTDGDGNGLFF